MVRGGLVGLARSRVGHRDACCPLGAVRLALRQQIANRVTAFDHECLVHARHKPAGHLRRLHRAQPLDDLRHCRVQAMDDMALDLARIALDFKHLVEPQHPDDAAVDALAALMKAKLAKQRAKGYGGWNDKTQCPQQRLSDMLRAHVDKGDPVDVANFCAMLSARGEGIAAAPQAVQAAVQLPLLVRDIARDLGITVPQACIALKPLGNYSTNSAVTAEMARMLRDNFPAPAHPAEGVPAQAVPEIDERAAQMRFIKSVLGIPVSGQRPDGLPLVGRTVLTQ